MPGPGQPGRAVVGGQRPVPVGGRRRPSARSGGSRSRSYSAMPEVDRGQRGDRAGQAHQPVGARRTAGGRRRPDRAGRRPRPGRPPAPPAVGRVASEEPLAHPDTAELERDRGQVGVVGPVAGHQLGRSAADVEDEEGALRRGRGRPPPRPATGGPRRPRSAARARARWPRRPAARNSSPLAASRAADVAARRPRPTPRPSMTWRNSRSTATHRSIASGARRPVASTPWPRRVMRIRRSSGRPAASATRSRVELVPQSMAAIAAPVPCALATTRPGRPTTCRRGRPVGPAGAAGRQAGWSPIRRAVHSPTGSSAPVSHQARWACRHLTPSRVPPTPPDGRGPVWAGSIRASRSAA